MNKKNKQAAFFIDQMGFQNMPSDFDSVHKYWQKTPYKQSDHNFEEIVLALIKIDSCRKKEHLLRSLLSRLERREYSYINCSWRKPRSSR